MKEQKRSSKTIVIVSYVLKMSVNGITCVFVAHFRSSDTFESLLTSLTVNIHMSTKTCVTGNNFSLHKALILPYPSRVCTTHKVATNNGAKFNCLIVGQ